MNADECLKNLETYAIAFFSSSMYEAPLLTLIGNDLERVDDDVNGGGGGGIGCGGGGGGCCMVEVVPSHMAFEII